jgi:hypothetical protein
MPNRNSIFWNPGLANKAKMGTINPVDEDSYLLEKLSEVLEEVISGNVQEVEENYQDPIARFASIAHKFASVKKWSDITKIGEETFLEMPGNKPIVNPPVRTKEMEIEDASENNLPKKFAIGKRVVHLPTRRYGIVVSHATDLPLLAIVQFEDDKSVSLVDMRELALVEEFEHSLDERPVFNPPGKPSKDEEAEKILERYQIPEHPQIENPILEKIEKIKEAIKAVITDPLVSQKIITYLTENGVLNIDVQDLLKNIDILKLSTAQKAKLVRTLIDEGVLNKEASIIVLKEILGGK